MQTRPNDKRESCEGKARDSSGGETNCDPLLVGRFGQQVFARSEPKKPLRSRGVYLFVTDASEPLREVLVCGVNADV